ncbi:Fur-regulated basic protein FbpA [Thermaerobacillus caldiproteolyticus]|uniref:Fur-regulated basic protein FbpA n=1 Tax=Thermaerobacillus caldiproteolyticus TaxID=247480 RepID=UPI001F33357D|nr:Fur-regulated basic protein FbpA [Anoxybacillus caldiproteolyticus]
MSLALLMKHVFIHHLRRKGVFLAEDGRNLSKLTLEEVQREYERVAVEEGSEHNRLVKSHSKTASDHCTI